MSSIVQGLRAGVTSREVLAGIDLEVRSGEVHAVMGPNGSGKSTLAHVLMGKPGYQVLGGSVRLDGKDLLALPAWRRARLGLFLAPQYPTEVPGVRLQEMLAEALAGSGEAPGAGSKDRGRREAGSGAGSASTGRRSKPGGSVWRRSCSNDRSTSTCPEESESAARHCSWPSCVPT